MAVNLSDMKAQLTLVANVSGAELIDKFGTKLNTVGKTADTVNKQVTQLGGGLRSLAAGFGAMKVADIVTEFARVTIQLDAFQKQLAVGFGGQNAAELEKLRSIMRGLGIAQDEALGSAIRFTSSLRLSGQSAKDANANFEAASKLILSNKLSADGASRVYYAMAQIASKGKLMAEELNGQLGDVLAGFNGQVAQAMGMTGGQLTNAMKEGKVSAQQFFEALKKIGDGIDPSKLNSAAKALADVKNAWYDFKGSVLDADTVRKALESVATGIGFLRDHINEIKDTAKNVLELYGAFKLFGASKFVVDFFEALIFSIRTYGVTTTLAVNGTLALETALAALGGPVTIIAGLVAGLFVLRDAIHPVAGDAATLGDYFRAVGSYAYDFASQIASYLSPIINKLGGYINALAAAILGIPWSEALGYAKTFANGVIGYFVAIARAPVRSAEAMVAAFKIGFQNIATMASAFGDGFMKIFQGDFSFSSFMGVLGKQVIPAFKQAAGQIAGEIKGDFTYDYVGAAGDALGALRARANKIAAQRHKKEAQGDVDLPGNPALMTPADDKKKKKKKKGRKPPTQAEIDETFEAMLNGIVQEDVKARRQMTDTIEDRLANEKDALQQEIDEKRQKLKANKWMDANQRAIISQAIDQLELDKLAYLEAKARDDKRKAADKVMEAGLEEQKNALQIQLDLATTQADRRRIQLDILDLEERLQKAKLQEVIDAETGVSAEDKAVARRQMAAIDANHAGNVAKIKNDTMGPLQQWAKQVPQTAAQMNEALQNVAVNGLNKLTDGLMGVLNGTKSLGAAFKEMALGIIQDLEKILIEKMLLKALGAIGVPGFANGGAFSGGTQVFANGGAFSGGVQMFATGGVVSGATPFAMSGGRMGVMGEAGPEAIMPLRRLPNGRLGVETTGSRQGGNVTQNSVAVHVNVDGSGSSVQANAQDAAQLGRVISNVVRQELVNQQRPGGLLSSTR